MEYYPKMSEGYGTVFTDNIKPVSLPLPPDEVIHFGNILNNLSFFAVV